MNGAVCLTAGPVALRIARPALRGLIGLGALLAAALLLGVLLGEVRLGPAALLGGLLGDGSAADFVLWRVRLPRVAAAAGAGAALGLAGAVFQSLLRNPLASPDVIGFSAGAGFGVLAATVTGTLGPTLGAAAGGVAATFLTLALAARRGMGLDPLRIVLIGIGLSFTFGAGTELLMTRLPLVEAAQALRWLTGSFSARTWADAGRIAGWLIVLGAALAALRPGLVLMELGDEAAIGLGLRLAPARVGLALIATGLAAAGVAVAGPVPFVALLAAPLARRLAHQQGPALLGAALVGAAVTVMADLVARAAFPVQLQAGVVTGLIGAPCLLWLLAREMKGGRL